MSQYRTSSRSINPEEYDSAFIIDDAIVSLPAFCGPNPTHTAQAHHAAKTRNTNDLSKMKNRGPLPQVGTIIEPAGNVSLTNGEELASLCNPGLPARRMVGLVNGVIYVGENSCGLPSADAEEIIYDLLILSGRRTGVLVDRSTQPRRHRTTSATLTLNPSPSYPRARSRASSGGYHHGMPSSSVKVRSMSVSMIGNEGTCPSIVVEGPTLDEVEMGNWA